MNVPRWLNPKTNPALYTALASIALSVWQAIQVDLWRGSLTLPEVGRVAAPVVVAALAAWQRRKTTPLADPRDANGKPLVVPPGEVKVTTVTGSSQIDLAESVADAIERRQRRLSGIARPHGGYTGGKPASEMPPPPTDVPSVSRPAQPPAGTKP